MSKYTVEIRYILESYVIHHNLNPRDMTIDEIISNGRLSIFDFQYPLYDDNYRETFEINLLRNFYTREIGAETVALFKLFLQQKLIKIMPKYNKLFLSEIYKLDPLASNYEKTSYTGNKNETGDNSTVENSKVDENGNVSDKSTNVFSEYPQTTLAGKDYATSSNQITDNTDTTNSTITNNSNTTKNKIITVDDYVKELTGYNESPAELLQNFIQNYQSIESMIYDELADLFMLVW